MRLLHEANDPTRMQMVTAGWHHSISNLPMLSHTHGSIKGSRTRENFEPGLESAFAGCHQQICHVPLSDNAFKFLHLRRSSGFIAWCKSDNGALFMCYPGVDARRGIGIDAQVADSCELMSARFRQQLASYASSRLSGAVYD